MDTVKQSEILAKAESLEAEAAKLRADHGLDALTIFPAIGGELGVFEIDNRRGVFGIFFDINKLDYEGARRFVESAGVHIWKLYFDMAKQFQARQAIVKAGSGDIFKKLAGKA